MCRSCEWERFNSTARDAALWTKAQLTPENAVYVQDLPQGPVHRDGFQMVHGSSVDEDEYVLNEIDAARLLRKGQDPLTFFGHTHVQGGFVWNGNAVEAILKVAPEEEHRVMLLDPAQLYLMNPGSVGQPRDGDPRAAYILYNSDERSVTFWRVRYDVRSAQEKIRQAGLPRILADCLTAGRW